MEYKLKKIRSRKGYTTLNGFFMSDWDIDVTKSSGPEKIKITQNRKHVKKDEIVSKSRVWLLYGLPKNGKRWICLQVAESKNDTLVEIQDVLNYMVDEKTVIPQERDDSEFYKGVCPALTGKKYRKALYRMIFNEYSKFRFCFLDVDKYLGTDNISTDNDAGKIVDICKYNYAEAKIAYESLSVFWRRYNPGIDGLTISYFYEKEREQEATR